MALQNTIPSLIVGQEVVYTITLLIPLGYTGNLTSQVSTTSTTTDIDPSCTNCTDVDTLPTGADIVVTNTDGSTTYSQGSTKTYTLTVHNNGPMAATNVLVSNAIPNGISQFSWTGTNGSSGTNTPLNDTLFSLANGASVVYTITLQVPSTYTGNLTSEAIVTSSTSDPNPGCTQCIDVDTPVLTSLADIVITNTDNKNVSFKGANSVYTVTVTNNGPATANYVHVINAIPAGITLFSWTGSNGSSGTNVALNDVIQTLQSGSSVTYTITLFVPLTYAGNLVSTAAVTSNTSDPNIASNQSTDTDTLAIGADLLVTNTNNQNSYVPGSTVIYTVTVTNNGPSNAINVLVANPIPAGITLFSWTGSNGSSGTNVALSNPIANLAIGATVTYTITVQVPLTYTGNLTSTTTVTSATADPIPNTPVVDSDPMRQSDIVITNTNNQNSYIPGGHLYTVTVTNNGPTEALNVQVTNPIPAGITQFSWTGSNGSSGTNVALSNLIPLLLNGQSVVYIITIQVPLTFTGLLDSDASVTCSTDTVLASNQMIDSDTLAVGADIVVTNTNGQTFYTKGSTTIYTVTVTNNGPQNVTNVNVSNPIPAGITRFSWVGSNGSSGTNVPLTNTIASLLNGQTVTYTITVQIPVGFNGNLTSTASAVTTSAVTDPNPSCLLCVDTDTLGQTDVSVVTTNNQVFYTPGGSSVYTVTVTNNGTFPASNIQVNNPIPSE